ncbi:MAG: M17 family peptidase N-terminal domain-containing protein, partial [bacterium]
GMGLEETDSNDKAYRKVYSTLTRKVKSESIEKLAIFQPAKPGLLVEIVLLVDYEFTKYKSQDEKSKSKNKKLTEISIFADDFTAQDKNAIKNALVIAEATNK